MKYFYAGHKGFFAHVQPRLEKAGFSRCDKACEAEAVFTFFISQTELEDAYFDEGGFIQSMPKNTLLIDLSAATPNFARELGAVAMVNDLAFVEAPLLFDNITDDDALDARENAHCIVAGQEKDIERARPLLDALAASVVPAQGSGLAQLARASYMLQTAACVIGAIEASALYQASLSSLAQPGVSAQHVGAISPVAKQIINAIESEHFEGSFTIEIFMAQLSASLMAADDADLILPQAEAAMHLLELLAVIGGSDKGLASLSLVYGSEKRCAEHGLDWTRAEGAFGEDDECAGHGCCDHDDFDYTSN